MCKRFLFLLLFLTTLSRMQAQYISESASQDTANHVVILQGTLISGSKGLTNNTLIKFIRKDYFDPAAKKEILLRTYPVNSAGWEYNSSIRYQVNLRHKYQWSFMAGISSVNAFGFNRETAQLVLNGNSFYAGQMMPLDGLKYYNMTWQYVGTGLTGKYKQWSWEGKLQFLYAQSFSKLTVRQGNLYTETNGEYINLRVDGNYISSKGVPFSNPGIGGQLGIGYNYKNHCAWGAGASDFGVIFLNKHSKFASLDTALHFEGIIISGLHLPSQSKLEDSLKALPGQYIQSGAQRTYLPALLYIYTEGPNGKDQWRAGADYRLQLFRFPALWATYIKNIGKHHIHAGLTAGGYGIFGINAGYSYTSALTRLQLQFRNIEGFMAPRLYAGGGLFINFSQSW